MTSMFSIFNSSSQISARIEAMRSAEAALMSFANRFQQFPHDHHTENSQEKKHRIDLFNTSIPRSSVPLKKGKKCQMMICASDASAIEKPDDLTIHGVKVTYKTSMEYNNEKNSNSSENGGEAPLVLLHGYMNGALYFYRNLIGLSSLCTGGTVYALDVLGWGLSSRPKFELESSSKTDPAMQGHTHKKDKHKTHAAEQVFVESLEAWRRSHNIPKMILGGHSMGGYISVAYAEKYPERVDRLILISPAGVPDDKEIDVEGRFKNASLMARMMIGAVSGLFNYGITPAGFLRSMPESRGRRMVERYINGRLPSITCPEEQKHLGEYLYTNAALPGSGEDSLNHFLKPTAFAHRPTLHRIPSLKVKNVSFIYGQNDWMDPTGGIDTHKKCVDLKNGGKDAPNVEVYGVRNAGHLLMLENWEEFNAAMVLAMGNRGKKLPPKSPTPFKILEPGASLFFTPPRWGRKRSEESSEGSISADAAPAS